MYACAQEVRDLAPSVLRMPPAESELLYGRSGYLYALLFLRKYLGAECNGWVAMWQRLTPYSLLRI